MGLLRRPTTSKIVEDGRFSRPAGRVRIRARSQKTNLRLRHHPHISTERMLSHAERSKRMLGPQLGGADVEGELEGVTHAGRARA